MHVPEKRKKPVTVTGIEYFKLFLLSKSKKLNLET